MKAIFGVAFGLLFAFLIPARADEGVNLAGEPPVTPTELSEAHGRLDVDYLLIPEGKLGAFTDFFDGPGATPDLGEILRLSGGKVVATASTGLRLGGDGAMLEIADSRLTLRPRIAAPNQFHLDGRITRSTFSGTFDVLLQPGQYQLFVLWDQPPHGGAKDPYNAVIARMRDISVEGPNGEVRLLLSNPGALPSIPATGKIPPAPPPLPGSGKVLYENRGDNTNGFAPKSDSPNFTPRDGILVANDPASGCHPDASGWMALPVSVAGDFQVDFDVRADANDAMSWLMLFDRVSYGGFMICNRTNTSFGDPNHSISYLSNLCDTFQIFHQHLVLARASAQKFPDQVWTHVTITRLGHTLTDTVGGQTLSADVPADFLTPKLGLGLGYYATQNVGGNGQMAYANIRVVQR